MDFENLMVDVIRYLAAFTASNDVQHIAAARQAIIEYRREYGPTPDLMALWRVTLSVQRHISQIGVNCA